MVSFMQVNLILTSKMSINRDWIPTWVSFIYIYIYTQVGKKQGMEHYAKYITICQGASICICICLGMNKPFLKKATINSYSGCLWAETE